MECSTKRNVYTGKFKNPGMRQAIRMYHINKMKGETKPRRYEGSGSGRKKVR